MEIIVVAVVVAAVAVAVAVVVPAFVAAASLWPSARRRMGDREKKNAASLWPGTRRRKGDPKKTQLPCGQAHGDERGIQTKNAAPPIQVKKKRVYIYIYIYIYYFIFLFFFNDKTNRQPIGEIHPNSTPSAIPHTIPNRMGAHF